MRCGVWRRGRVSVGSILIVCALYAGMGLLMLNLRQVDSPTSPDFPMQSHNSDSESESGGGRLGVKDEAENKIKRKSNSCAMVEEMGKDFKGGFWEESLRVGKLIQHHFDLNGASHVRNLLPEQFCQHGFVMGKASEAGFGNEMYKKFSGAALSILLNWSLIIGQSSMHPEMRNAASILFGKPEVLHSRPNVFGEIMRVLITPSEDVEDAFNWVLSGVEPDISLHLRMLMNKPGSFRSVPSRSVSFTNPITELNPLELMDSLFKECKHHGEIMVSEGIITLQDIEDAKSSKGSRVISIGLPAYCLLQALLRSAKANSVGILLSDNVTELTSSNRPKETFFDWFFNPLLIIKDQIKAENLSEAEEAYLCKLVLLNGDPLRSKNSNIGSAPESERKQAELDAFARRLQGITKSISRYPTFRRRFENLVNAIADDLAQNDGSSKPTDGPKTIPRSKSAFARLFSQKSFSFTNKTSNHGYDPESQTVVNDVTIT